MEVKLLSAISKDGRIPSFNVERKFDWSSVKRLLSENIKEIQSMLCTVQFKKV